MGKGGWRATENEGELGEWGIMEKKKEILGYDVWARECRTEKLGETRTEKRGGDERRREKKGRWARVKGRAHEGGTMSTRDGKAVCG
jgi:hypothetical protein